jgi:CheY-like chemotaxis protein
MSLETNKSRQLNSPHAKGKKILLVEDDPYWQLMIGASLRFIDKDLSLRCVRSAKHAEQALYAGKGSYDLIIADHFLNGAATGLDLWKRFQLQHSNIPFVMVSGLPEDEYLDLVAHESDYPPFLEKPLKIEKLKSILDGRLEITATKNRSSTFRRAGTLAAIAATMIIPTMMNDSLSPLSAPRETIVNTRPINTPKKIDLNDFFSPELKRQIGRIGVRADEILADLKPQSNRISKE